MCEPGKTRAAILVHTGVTRLLQIGRCNLRFRWRMAPGTRRTNFRRFSIFEKAGQAGIKSVGRTGLKGNDCIRMANGPASSTL
jgi:hypothetical protein